MQFYAAPCLSTQRSSEAFCELFGRIHKLEEIYITGDIAYNLISALQIPVNHPFGVHTLFPHLRFFFLEEIDLDHGNKACEELEDLLMQRYEYGVAIERLGFFECLQLSSKTIKRFSDIVVEVKWDKCYDDEVSLF